MSSAINSTYHFSCKSGAAYGDRYCQRISYYYANGPDQYPDFRAHSNASCAILQKPGVPNGTIACAQVSGLWTVYTTSPVADSDKPAPFQFSVTLYEDGGTQVSPVPIPLAKTDSAGNFSVSVNSLVPSGSTHTFYVHMFGVDPNGTPDGKDANTNTVPCGQPPAGGSCPSPTYPVTLPDGASPSASGNQGPSAPADTNSAYSTYYQEVPGNQTIIDANDQNTGPQYSSPTHVTWSPGGSQPRQTTFTLDYTNYKNDYGYDDHSTTVYYNQDYTQTVWTTGSSPSYYTCAGVRQGSALCPYTGTVDGWSCPSGYSNNGNGTCSKTYTGTKVSCFGAICNYSCNSGDSGGGVNNPTCTHTVSGTANHWTCGGGIGGGSSSTCYYVAQQWFVYTRGGSSTVTSPNNQYGGAPQFPECFDRGFAVNNVGVTVSLTDSDGTPDSEDPDNANSGASVSVTFSFPSGTPGAKGFRVGPKVSINYSGSFTNCSGGSVGGVITLSGPDNLASSQLPYTTSSSLPGGSCALPQPVVAGQTFCAAYNVSPPGSQMKNTGAITAASPGSVSGSGCSVPISNLPYAHFWGLDVSAGGAFATGVDGCATAPAQQSGIAAFVKGTGPLTRGSGAQFGALALGAVDTSNLSAGFGSAVLRPTGSNPTGRDGLTFANKGTLGNMGVSNHCAPDYFGTNPLDTPSAPVGNAIDMSPFNTSTTATPQAFYYGFGSGSQYNINGFGIPGTGINDANHVAIYVNGDVYIQNDIKFKNSAWASTAQIPSFYLIVKGNIYIGPGVHQLDGVYVAQPNSGSGGTINTCAPGFNRYANGDLFNNCNSQLVVNGAFAAQNVELDRTYASLRNSIGGEYPITSAINCTLGDKGAGVRVANSYDCAAEIFNFSPETYLSIPAISPTSNPNDGRFDYITSLSPVL
ncbi:MAG TPA: hypothetical protein VLG13_00065 [Patescibacteria group bacterium]|nr:hypothetical protein [Patescibacteria group bacterium]